LLKNKTMFTGIIEEIGKVKAIRRQSKTMLIEIEAKKILEGLKIGDSIATNGVCLTAISFSTQSFLAEAMFETLNISNLGRLRIGDIVNLERALRLGDRLDGHLVSGHIDGMGCIEQMTQIGTALELVISAPQDLLKLMVKKGSVAIDGTSLTITEVSGTHFKIALITHTQKQSILSQKHIGDLVNLENDMFAKYAARFMEQQKPENNSLSIEYLSREGF
jgi:riboflavin synthase, alpha subunit